MARNSSVVLNGRAAQAGKTLLVRPAARRRLKQRDESTALWLTAPALVLALAFIVYPVIETIRLSFFEWPGLGPATFVGLDNFVGLASDSDFATAVENNFLFAVVVTVGTVGLGTAFALAIDRRVAFWRVYRFVFFLPYILPMTIVAIMWANALDPNYGWLTGIVSLINPEWGVGALANPDTAMYVVCLVAIWQFAGFPMVMMLGSLSSIPRDIVEAARLDGAGPVQMAWRISLPLCKDMLTTVVLLQLIFSFKVFDLVQALTGGGPGSSTQVLGTLIFREAFVEAKFGYASAIALVASLSIIAISLVYLAVLKPGRIERQG